MDAAFIRTVIMEYNALGEHDQQCSIMHKDACNCGWTTRYEAMIERLLQTPSVTGELLNSALRELDALKHFRCTKHGVDRFQLDCAECGVTTRRRVNYLSRLSEAMVDNTELLELLKTLRDYVQTSVGVLTHQGRLKAAIDDMTMRLSGQTIPLQPKPKPASCSTVQAWVHELPRMQQAVILGALRGPDGVAKDHPSKHLVRWFRRCILITAFDGRVYEDMHELGGGSYTGPVPLSVPPGEEFLKHMDSLPWHYVTHFVWAAEILGYRHPTKAEYWRLFYFQCCNKMHVGPETEGAMNERLGDDESKWRKSE